MDERMADGAHHGVPRRRQRDRARGRAGAARRSRPTSRSWAPPPTTTSSSPAPTRPRPRCSSPTSACRRTSSRRASTRRRSSASATPAPGSWCSRSTTTPSTPSRSSATAPPGYAYLLKDRVAEGDQLARAVREVATGGSVLDPKIVEALVQPVTDDGGLTADRGGAAARGRRGQADQGDRRVAAAPPRPRSTDAVEELFLKLSQGASAGTTGSLRRLRMLHQAIVDREEQGETLSRLLPGGLAEKVRREGRAHRRDRGARGHRADVRHPRLLGDRRARATRRSSRRQLNEHRAEMNRAILDEGGTVMQFIGDAVMACFGAPVAAATTTPTAPLAAALAMLERAARAQRAVGERRAAARSASASGCRPGRSRPRCSAPRSGSSTRSSATP